MTSRITEKISALVSGQLPEFVRTDNPTFVAFIEYYYKFLEQDQEALELVQNARSYSDIDLTVDSFVNYFLTNYAKDLPYSLQVNRSLLIKRIKDLYSAKGSTLSIDTLFKVLYDTKATTQHPYDFVLRPSDGRWSLRTSIRVQGTFGSTSDIKDRFITVTKNNIVYTAEVTRVKNLTTNLYEIFYHSITNVPFEIDDTVTISSATEVLFIGIIKPTTTSWSIGSGGAGFSAGQIFNVAVFGAVDTLVRITRVSPTGAIQGLKILNYGYNFTEDIVISLTNALGVSAYSKIFDTSAGGFSETFEILQYEGLSTPTRYFDTDYVDSTYTAVLLVQNSTTSQILTSSTVVGTENPGDAIITFSVGAVARYPGEYTSTQGFLSEPDVRLQDGNLYQPFAYQIESELDISVFYDIVKKLVHQAGTNLYVNRIVSTSADLSANVTVETRKNVYTLLNSTFSTLDSTFKSLNKTVDIDIVNVTESPAFTLYSTINNTDSTVTLTESVSGTLYQTDYVSEAYFAQVYVADPISGTVVF